MHCLVSLSMFSFEEDGVVNNTVFLGLTEVKNLFHEWAVIASDSCIQPPDFSSLTASRTPHSSFPTRGLHNSVIIPLRFSQ